MRALSGVSALGGVAALAAGCGAVDANGNVSILLTSDGTHPCAGAVRLRATLQQVGGDSVAEEAPAAVAPDQLDCDFSVGVAEALYGMQVADADSGQTFVVRVELFDSTALMVAAGATEPFDPGAGGTVELQLTRVAPLGTVLVDLWAEPDFAAVSGSLAIAVLAGAGAIGARSVAWPGEAPSKRPLRISGIAGFGLRLYFEVVVNGDAVVSRFSEVFSVGSSPDDAFAEPRLTP